MGSNRSSKRVLLVGTSYSAAPLLMTMKALGLQVAVCGSKPADPCVALADEYFELDYADRTALLQLVRRERFLFVCPSCNDIAYLSAAFVADHVKLPGFDPMRVASTLHNKAEFRNFASAHKIPSPRAHRVTLGWKPPKKLAWPALVKPVDSFSGRGMAYAASPGELPALIESALAESRSSEIIVEEFLDGTLHSHSAFISGGKIAQDFFVDEFCQVYAYQVDCSNYPSRLPAAVRAAVRKAIRRLSEKLGLVDGMLHTQIIVSGTKFAIVECMRRCPGDLYFHLIEYATGASYIRNYVAPFIGEAIAATRVRNKGNWIRHTISFPHDTIFWATDVNIPANDVRLFPLCESGDVIRHAPYGKAAILFARMDKRRQMFRLAPKIAEYVNTTGTALHHD